MMFVAHWQIYHYHIDQHSSRIVCEHLKDEVPCEYITDHEADMKQNMHKLHDPAIKTKIAA